MRLDHQANEGGANEIHEDGRDTISSSHVLPVSRPALVKVQQRRPGAPQTRRMPVNYDMNTTRLANNLMRRLQSALRGESPTGVGRSRECS